MTIRRASSRTKVLRWTAIGMGMSFLSGVMNPAYQLRYNPSESAPRGLYLFLPAHDIHVGSEVFVRLPTAIAAFAATRDYLPLGVPILKHIAAMGGQRICRRGEVIVIDEKVVVRVRSTDGRGRPLIQWTGCRELTANELFLLGSPSPVSFDSRYFGPVDRSLVVARAVPLWTW